MKKIRKALTLCIAVFMVMQIVLPTLSQAVDTVKLNIQSERPYSDDNGDGETNDDIYTLVRNTLQTIFKIGEQDENGNLNFDSAYYCLRGGLGFGSTETILAEGVDYTKLSDLVDTQAIITYFRDTLKINVEDLSDEQLLINYNSICWIADNMYLPKNENAVEMKTELLQKVQKYAEEKQLLNLGESMLVESSLLTDDDIEVVQQIAIWYFTNYDENGAENSLSLADTVSLANLLRINGIEPSNDIEENYNKNRAKQMNILYRYFIDTAKTSVRVTPVTEKLELDKTLSPKINAKQLDTRLNAYVVGPFKINEKVKGNIDYKFTSTLKYKTKLDATDWTTLEIDNDLRTVYLSDAEGAAIDRQKDIKDMIAGGEFYITILKDVLDISEIAEFGLDIYYSSHYYTTTAEVLVATVEDQPVLKVEKTRIVDEGTDNIRVTPSAPKEKEFDLALRKFITTTNNKEIGTRIPKVYLENLREGTAQTADYIHPKDAIYLKVGDIIIYTIRIYNEGELDGYATEVTDYLCDGLELVENNEINELYGWKVTEDGYLTTTYLADTLIKAYDPNTTSDKINRDELWQKSEDGEDGLYYADLQVVCRITEDAQIGTTLPNVAEISADKAVETIVNGNNGEVETEVDVEDRDSEPGNLTEDQIRNYENTPWYEDDDDYERVIIEPDKVFDLALRKYISNIERNGKNVEFTSRVPKVDTTPLTENKSTANYIHPKNVLTVKQGDIITYKLRIYNEGELDGYATEITDYLPKELGILIGYSGNSNWLIDTENVEIRNLVGEDGIYTTEKDVPITGIFEGENLSSITVVTGKDGALKIRDYLSLKDELIKKHGSEVQEGDLFQTSTNSENDGLFYQEIEMTCIVLAPNTYEGTLTNIAEISEDKAVETSITGNNQEVEIEVEVEDRDSVPNSLTEEQRNNYEQTPWYQDDDDYEPVQLKYFDLALRKFITGVNEDIINTRIPEIKVDEKGNVTYEHTKEPVEVIDKDNVTYTIRVFNEGTIAGYAEEIEDDIPEGLIYLPNNEVNKEYDWKMYYRDEEGNLVETDDVEKAEVIRTDYLSEAKGTVNEETGINSNLLKEFNKEIMETPDFRDVKVVFKVSQKDIPEENEDGIIINKAHITKDSDDDEDSIPDEWNEGEDDQDIEKVKVQKFDLALFKWVTQTIVTVDGKTTTTETGFKPNVGKTEANGDEYRNNDEEEPIAAVTIDKKKLNSTVVKFIYNIKVVNEGDIEGYATELTDYIPEGLKFVAEDNPLWTLNEDGKITTRALETKLLKPGESAEVPVTFTWINGEDNLGLKTNIAAITEDYNEKGVPDDDSTPGNENIPNYKEEQEDDDDFALVILTLKTGRAVSYIWLGFVIVVILSVGTIAIKKYVL